MNSKSYNVWNNGSIILVVDNDDTLDMRYAVNQKYVSRYGMPKGIKRKILPQAGNGGGRVRVSRPITLCAKKKPELSDVSNLGLVLFFTLGLAMLGTALTQKGF